MTDVKTADGEVGAIGEPLKGGMPRRPEYISDVGGRPRVRRESAPRFPFPMPNGWFIVSEAAELAPLEVKPVFYFGRDLVLYRTADGEARLVSAYCAHLGAHLGVGRSGRGRCHCLSLPRLELRREHGPVRCHPVRFGEDPQSGEDSLVSHH